MLIKLPLPIRFHALIYTSALSRDNGVRVKSGSGVFLLSRNLWESVSWLTPCVVFCLLYLLGAANPAAQTPPTAPAQPDSSERGEETAASPSGGEATLVIQNRTITVFRSRFFGRSPAVRVEGAQRQFREVIASRRAGTVTARAIPQGVQVSIGEEGIFTLTPEDLDQVSEEAMDEAAERAVNNLTVAYAETLELRDARRMSEAVGSQSLQLFSLSSAFGCYAGRRSLHRPA
ncbi:MAG: hypothetical protein M3416_02400 [Acidobacteriota bacterium]|nr:hypothetical protein [Acidobacteriota bacterium]